MRPGRGRRAASAALTAVGAVVSVLLVLAVGAGALLLVRSDGDEDPGAQRAGAAPSRTPSAARTEATPQPDVGRTSAAEVSPSEPTASPVERPRPPDPVFPVASCRVSYVGAHHDYPAADIFAARGCAFVAPVDGRVDEVSTRDSWSSATNVGADRGGLFVSIVGRDGVRYYGSHLESVPPGVRPGVEVRRGQTVGRVGDTGSARGTGTHLHFGLSWPTPEGRWWVRRGVVPPARFLDAWRAGRSLGPADAVRRARAGYGDDSRCLTYC